MGQGFIKKNGGSLEAKGKYEQLVNYTMLYDHGNECTAVTGGWSPHLKFVYNQGEGYATKQSNYLDFGDKSTSFYGNGGFYVNNAINLTEYTGYCADVEVVSYNGYYYYYPSVTGFVTSGKPPYPWADATYSNYTNLIDDANFISTDYGTERRIGVMPIRDINVSAYLSVCANCAAYPNMTCQAHCYSAWLIKEDNWSELASIAEASASDISELLTKSSAILNNKNAVNFMIYQCTGEFMTSAIQNSTFMTELASSPYKEKVYANEHWAKFLAMVS